MYWFQASASGPAPSGVEMPASTRASNDRYVAVTSSLTIESTQASRSGALSGRGERPSCDWRAWYISWTK